MPDLPHRHLLPYAFVAVAILALGARQLARESPVAPADEVLTAGRAAESVPAGRDDGAAPIRVQDESGGAAVVHVAGEVRRPGVYRIRAGARVDDAVRRAGGPTRGADLSALNLAARVQDGRQVLVPARPSARSSAGAGGAASAGAGAAPSTSAPLNLNTATLEQLEALDGIGPGMAQKILEYRDEQDGFGSVEELDRIPGIGAKRLAALRERVTV